jgi:hypothetical protein
VATGKMDIGAEVNPKVFVTYIFNAENFMEIEVQNTESRQIGIMYQWQKSEQDMNL